MVLTCFADERRGFLVLTTDRSEFPIPKVLMTNASRTTLLRFDKFFDDGKQGIPRVLTAAMADAILLTLLRFDNFF